MNTSKAVGWTVLLWLATFSRSAAFVVQIVSPTNASAVNAGADIAVVVESDLPMDSVVLRAPGAWVASAQDDIAPFAFQVRMPRRLGPASFAAIGEHDGEFGFDRVSIDIVAPEPLASLSLDPGEILLRYKEEISGIVITGTTATGATFDISPSATGLSFATASGNSSVVSVSERGLVAAIGPGADEVVVSLVGLEARARVTVELANLPPTLADIGTIAVDPGSLRERPIIADDPESTPISFAILDAPAFVSITSTDATHGVLSAAPSPTDVGNYTFHVLATDAGSPPLTANREVFLVVGSLIFEDGFETGSTGAWSAWTPSH